MIEAILSLKSPISTETKFQQPHEHLVGLLHLRFSQIIRNWQCCQRWHQRLLPAEPQKKWPAVRFDLMTPSLMFSLLSYSGMWWLGGLWTEFCLWIIWLSDNMKVLKSSDIQEMHELRRTRLIIVFLRIPFCWKFSCE